MRGAILLTTDPLLVPDVELALGGPASGIRLDVCGTPLQLRDRVAAQQSGCAIILLDDRAAGSAGAVIVRHLRTEAASTPIVLLSYLDPDDARARAAMIGADHVVSLGDRPLPPVTGLLAPAVKPADRPRYRVLLAGAGTSLFSSLGSSERLQVVPTNLDAEHGTAGEAVAADALLVAAPVASEELAFALQRVRSRVPMLPIIALCDERMREALFRLDVFECLPLRPPIEQVEQVVERAAAHRRLLLEHAALKSRESRLRMLVEGFPDGVLLAGPDHVVQAANAAALGLLGGNDGIAVVGQRLSALLTDDGAALANLTTAVTRGERATAQLRPLSDPARLVDVVAVAHQRDPLQPRSVLISLRAVDHGHLAAPLEGHAGDATELARVRDLLEQEVALRLASQSALQDAERRQRELEHSRDELEARLRAAEEARRLAEETHQASEARRRAAEEAREHLVDLSLAEVARWQEQVETLTAELAALTEQQRAAESDLPEQARVRAEETEHLRAALRAEHVAALEARDAAHRHALAEQVEATRQALAEEHAAALDTLRERLQAEQRALVEAARETLSVEHVRVLAAERDGYRTEHADALAALRTSLVAEHDAELAARDAAREVELATVRAAHETAAERWRADLDVAEAYARRLESELAASRDALAEARDPGAPAGTPGRPHLALDGELPDLLDAAALGFVCTDEAGRVLGASDAAARLCGHANATALLQVGELPEPIRRAAGDPTVATELPLFEVCVQGADGALRWILGGHQPHRADGGSAEIHWILLDRCEHHLARRRAQSERRTQLLTQFLSDARSESLTLFEQASRALTADEPGASPDVEATRKALDRARWMLQQLSMYAERRPRRTAGVDLAGLLVDAAPLLARLAGEETSCEVVPPSAETLVPGDPAEYQDLLTGLVLAGRESLRAGGQLTLTAAPTGMTVPVGNAVARTEAAVVRLRAEGLGAVPLDLQPSFREILAQLGAQVSTERDAAGICSVSVWLPRVLRLS